MSSVVTAESERPADHYIDFSALQNRNSSARAI